MTICQHDELMADHSPQVPSSTHPADYLITSAFPSLDIALVSALLQRLTLLQRVLNIEKKEGNPIKNNRIALIFGREILPT